MRKTIAFVFTFVVIAAAAWSQVTFTISSTAYSGKQERGFDSGLISAGRADPAYNGSKSLPFSWSGLPAGTKFVAVVYDDPDARLVMKSFGVAGETWIHWLVTDLDPALGGLSADAAASGKLVMGINSWGSASYGGPNPPGNVPSNVTKPIIHIYRLKLYALSAPTGLKAGFTADELLKAMEGKILGTAQLNISYSN